MRSRFKRVITDAEKQRLVSLTATPAEGRTRLLPAVALATASAEPSWPAPSDPGFDPEDWLWMTGLPGRARQAALKKEGR